MTRARSAARGRALTRGTMCRRDRRTAATLGLGHRRATAGSRARLAATAAALPCNPRVGSMKRKGRDIRRDRGGVEGKRSGATPSTRTCRAARQAARRIMRRRLLDRQHAIERDLRPVLAIVGNDDAVVNLAVDEAFEDPQQMIRRDAEHRGTEAAELIERVHGPLRLDFTREPVDEMNLSRNRPHRTGRTVLY